MKTPGTGGRLAPVDGLRAVAVLGVMWWHSWMLTGNPWFGIRWAGHSLNLERLLVPLGTGFQLFFVLSGFCLHGSFQALRGFSAPAAYGRFLVRRWLRLSPAFYVVCASTALVLWLPAHFFSARTVLAHVTWLLGWIPGIRLLSPVFWTLQVEWEFYLFLPLLFLGRDRRFRTPWLVILLAANLLWRSIWYYQASSGIPAGEDTNLLAQCWGFAWGMMASEAWRNRSPWLSRLSREWVTLLGVGMVWAGRGLLSNEVFSLMAPFGWVAKTLSQPILTLGYAIVLVGALSAGNRLLRWLTLPFLQTTGRISYGLYLWHWWPSVWIGAWAGATIGPTAAAQWLTLGLTLLVTYPLAWLTFRYLEAPFHRPRRAPGRLAGNRQ